MGAASCQTVDVISEWEQDGEPFVRLNVVTARDSGIIFRSCENRNTRSTLGTAKRLLNRKAVAVCETMVANPFQGQGRANNGEERD